jgi:DNA processing protein
MDNSLAYAALAATLSGTPGLSLTAATRVLNRIVQEGAPGEDLLDSLARLNDPHIEQSFEAAAFVSNLDMIRQSESAGIRAISILDPYFPRSLASIQDAPLVIYVRGSIRALESLPGLAVVGTRQATANGLIIAERIAKHFAKKGWVIVSGLALGIDAAAHRGALSGNGSTIAVMAHGLDTVYPKTNKNLAEDILQRGGALVSEYPIGYPARPEQFVLRNRIQIGLSAGSVIVEGEEKSGTKTQAEFCLRNRRHLFAVIPTAETELLQLQSTLPRMLVEKRGAVPVVSKGDYDKIEKLIEEKRRDLLAG